MSRAGAAEATLVKRRGRARNAIDHRSPVRKFSIRTKVGVTAVHRSGSETGTIKRISRVQPSCDSLAREMRVSAAWT